METMENDNNTKSENNHAANQAFAGGERLAHMDEYKAMQTALKFFQNNEPRAFWFAKGVLWVARLRKDDDAHNMVYKQLTNRVIRFQNENPT